MSREPTRDRMSRRVRWHAPLLACAALIGLSGCESGPSYSVVVDAYANPQAGQASTYAIVPAPGMQPDLEFEQVSQALGQAMQASGMAVAPAGSSDATVYLGFSMSDPQQVPYTYSIPMYGQTGYSSARTTGTATTHGQVSPYGTYSGTTHMNATTHYQPTYGITGFSQGSGVATMYTRQLSLNAVSRDGQNLWTTRATSIGSTGSVRTAMPVLIAASQPYLGKSTNGERTVQISPTDRRVRALVEQRPTNQVAEGVR